MKRLLPVLVVLSACATMAGMRTEPLAMGVAKVYETDLAVAVRATRTALLGSALEIDDVEEINCRTWMFLAKRKSGQWTWGELVRVIVEETGEKEVTVRIISKRRSSMNVTARSDWSDAVFAQLALDLTEKQPERQTTSGDLSSASPARICPPRW